MNVTQITEAANITVAIQLGRMIATVGRDIP
jgi:hypothetical protein